MKSSPAFLLLPALSLPVSAVRAFAFGFGPASTSTTATCPGGRRSASSDALGGIPLRATKADELLVAPRPDFVEDAPAAVLQAARSGVVDTAGMPSLIPTEDGASAVEADDDAEASYRRGLMTIGFITLLFASNSPALHAAFSMATNAPPALLINAAVTTVGLGGVVSSAPFLGEIVPDPSRKLDGDSKEIHAADDPVTASTYSDDSLLGRIAGPSAMAGAELGLWKTLGTTANVYGLSLTSSDHGAFLIQLTTLIVPAAQGLAGVPIPTRIWTAIGLALGGVFLFTQDPSQSDCASLRGDLLCASAAVFYAAYDLRLFKWGKVVATDELIATKMVTQSALSLGMLAVLGREETTAFLTRASALDLRLVGAVALWSGLAVNCVAPYLQVSGQQAVGPARAQILYASQPLWASIMGFFLLDERFGPEGYAGGTAFLGAMFLAATAETPDPDCPAAECEV